MNQISETELNVKATKYAIENNSAIPLDMLNSNDPYDVRKVGEIENAIKDSKQDFIAGYKQAIHDLS
jgi:hypothetical protein